jgi:tetratricopeptide (TPR) repeat protein
MALGERWELLGAHVGIVDGLLESLRRIQAGDASEPRIVVLRAPAGYGKSRIIREVYERLRASQPHPHFWPPLSERHLDDDGIPVPLGERKLIGPPLDSFTWAPDSLPEFGWWALNCERGSDRRRANVLADARERFSAFLPALAMSWARKAGVWDRVLAKRRDAGRLLREAAAGELTDAALNQLQQALNVAIPGIGTIARWVWQLGKTGARHVGARQDLATSVELGGRVKDQREAMAGQVATSILQLTRADLPGLVVVEDAHYAAADLLALLDHLKQPTVVSPALVILTCWPEGGLRSGWDSWLEGNAMSGFSRIVDVPRLSERDLVEVVHRYAPSTRPSSARRLAVAMPSPLLLELWLSLDSTQRVLRQTGGGLVVDRQLAVRLPSTLTEVYRERWNELTPPVQRALMTVVALADPEDPVPAFLPTVVVQAAAEVFDVEESQLLSEGLFLAADPAAWTIVQGGSEAFREALLTEQARAALSMDAATIAALRRSALGLLRRRIDDQIEGDYWLQRTAENSVASEWLLDLSESAPSQRADVAAGWRHALDLVDKGRFHEAIELLELCRPDGDTGDAQLMRRDLAQAHGAAGHYQKARGLLREAAPAFDRHFGPDSSECLELQDTIATLTGLQGEYSQAVALYDILIPKLSGSPQDFTLLTLEAHVCRALFSSRLGNYQAALDDLGAVLVSSGVDELDPYILLQARLLKARLTSEMGDPQSALSLLDGIIDSMSEQLGPRDEMTFVARALRLALQTRAGVPPSEDDEELFSEMEEALGARSPSVLALRLTHLSALASGGAANTVELAVLVSDAGGVWGQDAPEVLSAQAALALALSSAGLDADAVAMMEDVIDRKSRLVAVDHLELLDIRSRYARILFSADRAAEAIEVLDEIITAYDGAFGPDHSASLQDRSNRAAFHDYLGHSSVAMKEFEQVLPRMVRVLGHSHRDTLITQEKLAFVMSHCGRPAESLALIREVVEIRTSLLGPDHLDTQQARSSLGRVLWNLGEVDKAVSELQHVFAVHQAALGPAHNATLNARRHLAEWRCERGELADGIEELRIILAARTSTLGEGHRLTLEVREALAFWLGKNGLYADAAAQYEEILQLPDEGGPRDATRLRRRSNVAHWLAAAGRHDEAIAHLRAVLSAKLELYGRDAAETVETRLYLANRLGHAGHPVEAVELCRSILNLRMWTLGPLHPDTLTTQHDLAFWLASAGKLDEAVAISRSVLDARQRVLGPEHPRTLLTQWNLAQYLGDAGRHDEAASVLDSLVAVRQRVVETGQDEPLGKQQPSEVIPDSRRHRGNDLALWMAERARLVEELALAGQLDVSIESAEELAEDAVRLVGSTAAERGDRLLGNLKRLKTALGSAISQPGVTPLKIRLGVPNLMMYSIGRATLHRRMDECELGIQELEAHLRALVVLADLFGDNTELACVDAQRWRELFRPSEGANATGDGG